LSAFIAAVLNAQIY
jgi:hypothetical protein